MDTFKLVSDITKQILGDPDLEVQFGNDPEAVFATLLPEEYDGTDEDKAALLEDIKGRVVMWTRNTGVASSLE